MRNKALPSLTVDELQFAMAAAKSAGGFKTPVRGMMERTTAIEIEGETYRFTDHPMNHAALAIMEALSHDRAKAQSALYRIMMIVPMILKDERHKEWTRPSPTRPAELEVNEALMEAIATVPASLGQQPSLDAVFALAMELANSEGSN